jgi:hypothetical protein
MAVALNATLDYFSLTTSHTSASGSNTTETYTPPVDNVMHKGLLLVVSRTAETGTCTLDAQVEFYAPNAGTWLELEGAAIPQFADGATGDRYLQVYPGITGSDADDSVALDTAEGKKCGQYLPRTWRVKVTNGGTTVTNTYSIDGWYLP